MKIPLITLWLLTLCTLIVGGVYLIRGYRATKHLDRMCGAWIASDNRSVLFIEKVNRSHFIHLYRLSENGFRKTTRYRLFYRGCIGYTDNQGVRFDLFVSSRPDGMLLFPGGVTYRRLPLIPAFISGVNL